MRAPLEHLVLSKKLALIHRDDSFQNVGGGLSHWDEEVGEEISSIYIEVKEPFTAGVLREFCFEFPVKSVFHYGDGEGILHAIAFEHLTSL